MDTHAGGREEEEERKEQIIEIESEHSQSSPDDDAKVQRSASFAKRSRSILARVVEAMVVEQVKEVRPEHQLKALACWCFFLACVVIIMILATVKVFSRRLAPPVSFRRTFDDPWALPDLLICPLSGPVDWKLFTLFPAAAEPDASRFLQPIDVSGCLDTNKYPSPCLLVNASAVPQDNLKSRSFNLLLGFARRDKTREVAALRVFIADDQPFVCDQESTSTLLRTQVPIMPQRWPHTASRVNASEIEYNELRMVATKRGKLKVGRYLYGGREETYFYRATATPHRFISSAWGYMNLFLPVDTSQFPTNESHSFYDSWMDHRAALDYYDLHKPRGEELRRWIAESPVNQLAYNTSQTLASLDVDDSRVLWVHVTQDPVVDIVSDQDPVTAYGLLALWGGLWSAALGAFTVTFGLLFRRSIWGTREPVALLRLGWLEGAMSKRRAPRDPPQHRHSERSMMVFRSLNHELETTAEELKRAESRIREMERARGKEHGWLVEEVMRLKEEMSRLKTS